MGICMSTPKLIQRHDLLPLPDDLKVYFSDFKACVFDGGCDEPVAWGYEPRQWLGPDLWRELEEKYGMWHCTPRGDTLELLLLGRTPISEGQWYLITKYLTLEEAKEKYGSEVQYERGPRGGFRSMTVGGRQFLHELLPADYAEKEAEKEKARERKEEEEWRAYILPRFSEEGKTVIRAIWKEQDELSEGASSLDAWEKRFQELQQRKRKALAYYHCPEWFDNFTDEGRRLMLDMQREEYDVSASDLSSQAKAEKLQQLEERRSRVMKEHYHPPCRKAHGQRKRSK